MSPIFVRPVREQLEHDRLVRYLHLKYKRRFDVAINMGDEQLAPVKIGALTLYPDLVLTSGRKLAGVIEVESGESVNNLEAMAQWVHFSRSRVPFHLYVPVTSYETARRLCEANQAQVTEIWTYRPAADGFDLVRMFIDTSARPARPALPARPIVPAKPARSAKAPSAPIPAKGRPSAGKSLPKNGKPQPKGKAKSPRPSKGARRPGRQRKLSSGSRARAKAGGFRKR